MRTLHSGYITRHLRSATKEKLLDGVSSYNQGYDTGLATYYRRIPADILAEIHAVQVEIGRLHDRQQLLLKAGWLKGRMPTDITKLMDRTKHKVNHEGLLGQ
jgi:hypothetical protein